MNVLKNKNCLITGATGGIGNEIAKALAKKKCNLFLTSTSYDKLVELSEKLKKYTSNISYCVCDFLDLKQVGNLIILAKKRYNNIDILVNCAGMYLYKDIENSQLSDFDFINYINVKVPWMLCKEFSKEMKFNKWGRIINIGSIAAYHGYSNNSLYSMSKHALLGLSRSLHKEFKPFNVRVFNISPAGTKTRMGKQIPGQNYNTFIKPKEIANYIIYILTSNYEMIEEEVRLNRYKEE